MSSLNIHKAIGIRITFARARLLLCLDVENLLILQLVVVLSVCHQLGGYKVHQYLRAGVEGESRRDDDREIHDV